MNDEEQLEKQEQEEVQTVRENNRIVSGNTVKAGAKFAANRIGGNKIAKVANLASNASPLAKLAVRFATKKISKSAPNSVEESSSTENQGAFDTISTGTSGSGIGKLSGFLNRDKGDQKGSASGVAGTVAKIGGSKASLLLKWKKIKLIAIACCAGFVFLLIFAIIAAPAAPLGFGEGLDTSSEDFNYSEEYKEYWGVGCSSNGCDENMQKMFESQEKFYKKLDSFNLTKRQKNIIVSTLLLNYSFDEFTEDNGAYTFTSEDDENSENNSSSENNEYEENIGSIDHLVGKIRNGEDAYFEYLKTSDYLDKRPKLISYYEDYSKYNSLNTNNINSWPESDRIAVREQIISNIKGLVDGFENKPEGSNNLTIAMSSYNLCPNGVTGNKSGSMSLDEYVAGVVAHEYGSMVFNFPEAAKVAAIAARTYTLITSNNCTKTIKEGEFNVEAKRLTRSTVGYDKYMAAATETSGQIFVDSNDNPMGGQWVTMPTSQYIEKNGGLWTFKMQGIAGYPETNYTFTISEADARRIASPAGGIYPPQDSSGHHFGISQYALIKMAEDGMSYEEIINKTYGVGGIVKLAQGNSNNGVVPSYSGTFLKRITPASPNSGNKYYNFKAFNYGQCAWYAQERSDEIMSTMNWKKPLSWIRNDGNGGNGGDYCWHNGYSGFTHYWNYDDPQALQPGFIISWTKRGGYGHVAVIEDVNGDTITISEAWISNPNPGHQTIRNVSRASLRNYNTGYRFACTIDLSSGR